MKIGLPSFRTQLLFVVLVLMLFAGVLLRGFFISSMTQYQKQIDGLRMEEQISTLYTDLKQHPDSVGTGSTRERVERLLMNNRQIQVHGQFFLNEMEASSRMVFLFLILISLLIFPLMYSMITRPLRRLVDATRELGQGNFQVQVEESREKSINRLIRSFNRMIRELVRNREQLLAAEREAVRQELESRRMHDELAMARHIQEAFLPGRIQNIPGCDLAARQRFCTEVAGDYHDVIMLESGRVVLAVGDVAGKGAGPALIMANLQAALRTALRVGGDLVSLVSEVNELLYQNTPDEAFVTFFIAQYHYEQGLLEYINAGHNPPLVRRVNGEFLELQTGGPILGVLGNCPFEAGQLQLETGDQLFIYTDGLNEAEDGEEEQFGEDRIRQLLEKQHLLSAQELLTRMENAVVTHTGSENLADDLTMMLLTIL